MSKKSKGKKLDVAVLFDSSLKGITPDSLVAIDRPLRSDYSGNRFGNRFSGASDGDKSRGTGDKWDNAFANSWRSGDRDNRNPASSENTGEDKYAAAFRKGANRFSSNPEKPPSQPDNVKVATVIEQVPQNPEPAVVSTKANSNSLKSRNLLKKEAQKKINESKSASAAKSSAAKSKAIEHQDSTYDAAVDCVRSGILGDALISHIEGLETKLSGAALVKAILATIDDPVSLKWLTPSSYGSALQILLKNDENSQILALNNIVSHCHAQKFPKVPAKDGSRNLVELLFQLSYQHDIISEQAFLSWVEDDSDVDGKKDALFKTVEFIQFLQNQSDSERDDDDEEDEDIDAPLQTVP